MAKTGLAGHICRSPINLVWHHVLAVGLLLRYKADVVEAILSLSFKQMHFGYACTCLKLQHTPNVFDDGGAIGEAVKSGAQRMARVFVRESAASFFIASF
eukprot:1141336-Pelagomonas_calceolata.AAC.6